MVANNKNSYFSITTEVQNQVVLNHVFPFVVYFIFFILASTRVYLYFYSINILFEQCVNTILVVVGTAFLSPTFMLCLTKISLVLPNTVLSCPTQSCSCPTQSLITYLWVSNQLSLLYRGFPFTRH